jgi:ribosomal protein L11 methyltransferase
MGREWIEITVRTEADPGEVLSLLADSAVCGGWQDDGLLRVYWPADARQTDHLIEIGTALERLGHPMDKATAVLRRLADKDWNEPWARTVRPIRLGRVVIRPSWHRVTLEAGQKELIIDPKQAFGTGHHATTQLLIEWLQELIAGGETVLDVGTGSGILAMAALRVGAARAVGIDHDPVAVGCARAYAEWNGFRAELLLVVGTVASLRERTSYPVHLVLANLDREAIVGCRRELGFHVRTGARLLVSGLLAEQSREVTRALAHEGLYVRTVREREGWLAFDVTDGTSCEEPFGEGAL